MLAQARRSQLCRFTDRRCGKFPWAQRQVDEGAGNGGLRLTGAVRTSAVAVACGAVLMGCSSAVTGMAVKAPEPQDSDGVNVALMDTGNYPTHGGHPLGTAGNPQKGAYLEGVRMAEFVIGPWEVDATLRDVAIFNTEPIPVAAGLKADVGEEQVGIAAAHGFIAGFSTARNSQVPGPHKALVNLVMRFPDPQSAVAAAKEMAEKASQVANPAHRPASIPRHPEAMASAYDMRAVPGCPTCGGTTVESYTAHGPYVLWQSADTTEILDVATQLVAKTLDLQGPRINDFAPTDPAKLADLPIDPTGKLLARVMPPPPDKSALPYAGVYPPRGALHFEPNPPASASLFTAAGVEMVAYRWGPTVYQAHDGEGAARVTNRFVADARNVKPATAVPGLPIARCFEGRDSTAGHAIFECVARADRYAFDAVSLQETDAKQLISAQYRILAGK